jgi:prephenate dehydratase
VSTPKRRKRLERIAIQGEPGAFSEEAATRLVGPDCIVIPCERFEDMFRQLKQNKATGAIVPIENSLHGSVHENYDHLQKFKLPIVAETSVRIVHNLIAPPGVPFSKIRRVYSHPVALNQCLNFFASHRDIEKMPFYDTAGSVKMVMEKDLRDAGAIASAMAADVYGARIVRRSIEDDRQNFTRFFLLRSAAFARRMLQPDRSRTQWKTSLVFTTRNVPGALFRCLSAFALRDVNLLKIESRPLRGFPWEYMFYLDFLGHLRDLNVQNALRHLGELADMLRVLGCYPRGD